MSLLKLTTQSSNFRCSQDDTDSLDNAPDHKSGGTVFGEEFAEGEVFAFEEGGVGFSVDGPDSQLEDLDFDLESQEFGPIYVPSSYDDLMELWFDLSKNTACPPKNRSEGNISQVSICTCNSKCEIWNYMLIFQFYLLCSTHLVSVRFYKVIFI